MMVHFCREHTTPEYLDQCVCVQLSCVVTYNIKQHFLDCWCIESKEGELHDVRIIFVNLFVIRM